jgi:hypothetical protein
LLPTLKSYSGRKPLNTWRMIMDTIQTANFEIGFGDPEDSDSMLYGNQYGWFDHNEHGDEYGGFLFFKNGELVDYDGISGYLPKEVLDALEAIGFDVNEMRPKGE